MTREWRDSTIEMTGSELDGLTRERLEMAAYILRNHAALIMYAASRGEDLSTSRRRLIAMMCTGKPESKKTTKDSDDSEESMGSIRLSDMSEHEMSD